MLLAIYTTQVKKREKKDFKKRKIISLQKLASRGFEPRPSESVGTKSYRLKPLDHLGERLQGEFKRDMYSFSMVIDGFPG